MIVLPFGLLLIFGLFDGTPAMRFLILLADLSLVTLAIYSFKKKSKWTPLVEIVIYFLLLLPLGKIFVSFPVEQFNYFLFIFPTIAFVVMFPLSIYFSHIRRMKSYSDEFNQK